MARRRKSLGGSLAGSLSGSLAGDRAGSGAAFTSGVVDALVAAGVASVAFKCAQSPSHRLNINYTGPALRGRRAADSVQENFGFTSAGYIDIEGPLGMRAFFGASDGFLVTLYGQEVTGASGGNDSTAPLLGAGFECKIWDGATQTPMLQGALFSPIGVNAGHIDHPTSFGMVAGNACTSIWAGKSPGAALRSVFQCLNAAGWCAAYTAADAIAISSAGDASGSTRTFTPNTAVTGFSGYIAAIGAGAAFSTATLEQDGVACAGAGGGGGVRNGVAGISRTYAYASGVGMRHSHVLHIEAVLTAPQLAIARAFNAQVVALSV